MRSSPKTLVSNWARIRLHRQRLQGARLAVAGVVDQRPDGALLGLDRGHRGAHRGLVGDVERQVFSRSRRGRRAARVAARSRRRSSPSPRAGVAVASPIPDEQPVISTAPGSSLISSSFAFDGRTLESCAMRAVTFQAPGEVRVEEVPDPRAERSPTRRSFGSRRWRLRLRPAHLPRPGPIEPGFVIGHEYVGTVVAAGDEVGESRWRPGSGHLRTACGDCFLRPRRVPPVRPRACLRARRHARLAAGAQAELLRCRTRT